MKDWEVREIEGQLTQISADTMIVLETLNKLHDSKNDEIQAIRRALAAVYNAFEMTGAVSGALLRAIKDDD